MMTPKLRKKAEFNSLLKKMLKACKEANKARDRLKEIESFREKFNSSPPSRQNWLRSISAEFEARSAITFYQREMIALNQQLKLNHPDRW